MKILKKILLIDDDEVSNALTKAQIKAFGVCELVQTVTNGKQGLEVLQKYVPPAVDCPDLILLDINMPVMDGFEFLQNFATLDWEEKPCIVMYTSSDDPRDKQRALQFERVVGYIAKPLTAEKLEPILSVLQAVKK